jgi:predicted Zn-dependent protease
LEQGVLNHVQQGQTELLYRRRWFWPGTLAITVIVAACATNPVTGKREFTLMSEAQEIALGRESDAQIRAEMGVYEDNALQQYVSRIGLRLAKISERPNLPWQFTVLDQPAVNAFALPGGFIYITRGILPFLHDEAELAGVLGHEIGHVTARHSVRQYTRAVGGTPVLGRLGVFVPATRPFGQISEQALGLLFLKYGRDDERQADGLGVRCRFSAGRDPAFSEPFPPELFPRLIAPESPSGCRNQPVAV